MLLIIAKHVANFEYWLYSGHLLWQAVINQSVLALINLMIPWGNMSNIPWAPYHIVLSS